MLERDKVLPLVTDATIEQPYIDSALGALPSACSSDWCYCRELQRYADLKRLKPLIKALRLAGEALSPTGHFKYKADRNVAIGDAYNAVNKALAQFGVEESDGTDEAL